MRRVDPRRGRVIAVRESRESSVFRKSLRKKKEDGWPLSFPSRRPYFGRRFRRSNEPIETAIDFVKEESKTNCPRDQ